METELIKRTEEEVRLKRKKGENEAMELLKSAGFSFDETYMDDNTQPAMPDLKYISGRYVEVTHTVHNKDYAVSYRKEVTKTPEYCEYKVHSVSNIAERIRCKALKHMEDDIDLVVFCTVQEFERLRKVMSRRNEDYRQLMFEFKRSPFRRVFICKYDIETNVYYKDYVVLANATDICVDKKRVAV